MVKDIKGNSLKKGDFVRTFVDNSDGTPIKYHAPRVVVGFDKESQTAIVRDLFSTAERHRLAVYEGYLKGINGIDRTFGVSKLCFEIVGNDRDNPYSSLQIQEHFPNIWDKYYKASIAS
jgi:hypothetical protein